MSILHIVPGHSAAGSLKQALRIGRGEILIFEDSLEGGPIKDFTSLDEWSSMRKSYWSSFTEGLEDYPEALSLSVSDRENCLPYLQQAEEIVLWVGAALREQLLLAFIFRLFQCYQIDFGKLKLIEAYRVKGKDGAYWTSWGIGELNPDQLLALFLEGEKRSLTQKEKNELQQVWSAVTSSRPEGLMEYHGLSNPCFLQLHQDMLYMMRRYPDKRTGLNFHESQLLHYCVEKGPSATRIIGYTMGYSEHDRTGDMELFHWLKELGNENLPYPALKLTGNLSNLRETEARLTEIGQKFMNGEANYTKLNKIDYWVGGVHLTSENLWYYSDGKLVAHDQ